jgi:hypothetical protein
MRNFFQIATLVLTGAMLISIAPASAAITPIVVHHAAVVSGPDGCTAICGAPTIADTTDNLLPPRLTIDPCLPRVRLPVADAPEAAAMLQPATTRHAEIASETTDQAHARPRITCGGKSALADCAFPLGHLPDVSEREVRSVDGRDRIKLIPICDRLDASLTKADQNLAQHGNAETLVPAIAKNIVLASALGHARYRADDVVGIVMGTDTVMLYVHKM